MRRVIYQNSQAEAVAVLRRAPFVHLASTDADGRPLLKTLHGVVVDGDLCFHGAPAGEKIDAVGREVVVCAEEVVAEIPSWFLDPERACPATTYYVSAQVRGALSVLDDLDGKAAVLQALMERFQPAGGYQPIQADNAMYRKALQGIAILRLSLAEAVCKSKLGQNRRPEERVRVLEQLWQRGLPGDPLAIERILDACPELPRPSHLQGPTGVQLRGQGLAQDLPGALALMAAAVWNQGESLERLTAALRSSTAWVVALGAVQQVIGTARAVTDGGRYGWVYDVVVDPTRRRLGVATALMRLLLDHPALRQVRQIHLNTSDSERLYAKLGFRRHTLASGRLHLSLELGAVEPSEPACAQ